MKDKIKFLQLLKYLYFAFVIIASLTLLVVGEHLYMTILLVSLGIYIIILEAFDKDLKNLKIKGKGVEVEIEMKRAKEALKKKADEITNSIENKSNKEIDKEELHNNIQTSLDEAFIAGLRVGGHKTFNTINNFRIRKDENGQDIISWEEN